MARTSTVLIAVVTLAALALASLGSDTLKPRVSCVQRLQQDGRALCRVYLGYENTHPGRVTVLKGAGNQIHGPPSLHVRHAHVNSALPQEFHPGVHEAAFFVELSCPEAQASKWTLGHSTLTFREFMDVDCPVDCAGEAFGTARTDECGVCGGDSRFALLQDTAFYEVEFEVYPAENMQGAWCLGEGVGKALDARTRLPVGDALTCPVNVFERAVLSGGAPDAKRIDLRRSDGAEWAWEYSRRRFHPMEHALPYVMVGRFHVQSRTGPALEMRHPGETLVYVDGALRDHTGWDDPFPGQRLQTRVYIEAEDAHEDGSPVLVEIFVASRSGQPAPFEFVSLSDVHTCLCVNSCGLCSASDDECDQSVIHARRRRSADAYEETHGSYKNRYGDSDDQRSDDKDDGHRGGKGDSDDQRSDDKDDGHRGGKGDSDDQRSDDKDDGHRGGKSDSDDQRSDDNDQNDCKDGCNDYNPCTIDTCEYGQCVHRPKDCDDGDDCTLDKCDRRTGQCKNIPNPYDPRCKPPSPTPSPSETKPRPSPSSSKSKSRPSPSSSETKPRPSPSSSKSKLRPSPSSSKSKPPPSKTCPHGCDDYNPCTIDTCEYGQCVHMPKDCDDGDDCTLDKCDPRTGQCKNIPNPYDPRCKPPSPTPSPSETKRRPSPSSSKSKSRPSPSSSETKPRPSPSSSKSKLRPSPSSSKSKPPPSKTCPHGCDDYNPCTIDTCEYGQCVHMPKDCDDGDDCTLDKCDPRTGRCKNIPNPYDPRCKPPSPTPSPSETKRRPSPSSSKSKSRPSPSSSETKPRPSPSSSKSKPPPSKTCPHRCDDYNPCTIDTCEYGQCVHMPKDCDDGDDCTLDKCDPRTGRCKNVPNPYDPRCKPPSPTPSPSETKRRPSPSSSKSKPPPSKTCPHGCDDYNPCTIDTCEYGQCVHMPKDCDDGDDCTLDKCDGRTGRCKNVPNPYDPRCKPPSPTPSPSETKRRPSPSSSKSKSRPSPSSSETKRRPSPSSSKSKPPPSKTCPHRCDDYNPCTIDTCEYGQCVHTPKDCDDGDECTVDKCNRRTGKCSHVFNPYKPGCESPSPKPPPCPYKCDDGNKCTVDKCVDGRCVSTPKDCDDGDPCTTDSCNRFTGACQHFPNPYCVSSPSPPPKPSPSVCYPGDHHISVNISVNHMESFNISCARDKSFVFEYCVTHYDNAAVIIGLDPFDKCHIGERGSCDNRAPDTAPHDRCRFFDPYYPLATGWSSQRLGNKICFRTKFSVEELLGCRAFGDPDTPLVIKKNDHDDIELHGTVYTTTVSGEHCHLHDFCDPVLLSSSYDFHLSIDTHGKTSAVFFKSNVHFEARWAKTVWLSDGNARIFVDTCINQLGGHDGYPDLTKLVNPEVNTSAETGRPVKFINRRAECAPFHLPDKCCQRWELGTYDYHGSDEVSGIKPLRWDVMQGDKIKIPLYVFLDLGINRSPQKLWKGASLGSKLVLYRDRAFHSPYDPYKKETFIDCESVYGMLTVDAIGPHFWLSVEAVRLCVPTTGQATPYDADHPDSSGCNTPGVGMEYVLLYDRGEGYVNDGYTYANLEKPPSDPYAVGFSFQAKARSRYLYLVEVEWKVKGKKEHDGAYDGDHHVEFFMDAYDEVVSSAGRGYGGIFVDCPHSYYYDYGSRSCSRSAFGYGIDHTGFGYPHHGHGGFGSGNGYYWGHHFSTWVWFLFAVLFFFLIVWLAFGWFGCGPDAYVYNYDHCEPAVRAPCDPPPCVPPQCALPCATGAYDMEGRTVAFKPHYTNPSMNAKFSPSDFALGSQTSGANITMRKHS